MWTLCDLFSHRSLCPTHYYSDYFFLLMAILEALSIMRPFLIDFIDVNFFLGREHWYPPSLPATADWVLAWTFWILWVFVFLFFGLSMWVTRDEIGRVATIVGVVLVVWGWLQLVLQFFSHGVQASIFHFCWVLGSLLVYLLVLIYFTSASRKILVG